MSQVSNFIVTNRVRIGTILIFIFAITAKPSDNLIGVGSLILGAGAIIRIWAAGYLNRNIHLTINGPYRHSRNPLYLGTMLEWIGLLIMADQPILWVFGIGSYIALYIPTMWQEEKQLTLLFGMDYICYCQLVPRFIPRLQPANVLYEKDFSWQQVYINREHLNFAAVLVAVILIVLQR